MLSLFGLFGFSSVTYDPEHPTAELQLRMGG